MNSAADGSSKKSSYDEQISRKRAFFESFFFEGDAEIIGFVAYALYIRQRNEHFDNLRMKDVHVTMEDEIAYRDTIHGENLKHIVKGAKERLFEFSRAMETRKQSEIETSIRNEIFSREMEKIDDEISRLSGVVTSMERTVSTASGWTHNIIHHVAASIIVAILAGLVVFFVRNNIIKNPDLLDNKPQIQKQTGPTG